MIQESTLSRYWAQGRLPSEMRLTDGRRIQVIYPGVWSKSNGPDFLDALVSIDGTLARGAVELHVRASDWNRHGHGANPAYSAVVLHVVAIDDGADAVTNDLGEPVPTLDLGAFAPISDLEKLDPQPDAPHWLGKSTCLPTLGRRNPELLRRVLREEGWRRMVDKQLWFSQSLAVSTASEVLYGGILDALGFSANRPGMRDLAMILPLTLIETRMSDHEAANPLAMLLGAAGFLPIPDTVREACGVSEDVARGMQVEFEELSQAYAIRPVGRERWSLNRVRPSNHPAIRISSLANLIQHGRPDGLLGSFLSLGLDCGRSWDSWLRKATPRIGPSRRRQIITNVFAPFLAAYAGTIDDEVLAEDVAATWECLPGTVEDSVARLTKRQIIGSVRFPIRLALEEQGLHHISRNGCQQLRCFECPIAELALKNEQWQPCNVTDAES